MHSGNFRKYHVFNRIFANKLIKLNLNRKFHRNLNIYEAYVPDRMQQSILGIKLDNPLNSRTTQGYRDRAMKVYPSFNFI